MEIKRDWAGRPIEFTNDDGKGGKSFVVFFKDNAGFWIDETSVDMDDIPPLCGFMDFWKRKLTEKYWKYKEEKEDQLSRAVIVPRDDVYDPYADLDKKAMPEEKKSEVTE